ncbi:hypothetical protein BT93_A0652 [Corymbia citriodora subsp. variegata]|nr:hypothetical protein BT93_A0652 [Corymbia citriodora subsp. variegata]
MEEIIDVQEELEDAATTDPLEFPLLTFLSLVELPNLKTFFCGKHSIHCPSLIRLTISRCPKMMTFSSFNGRQQSMTASTSLEQLSGHINSGLSLPSFFNEKVLFPGLEELKLSSMGQLKRIWHSQLHGLSFCKLASLTIKFCENLSQVFPSNLMDRLQSLNEIEVVSCPSLEALFEPASLSSEKRQKPLVFSAFKKMKLSDLPSLRDILRSDCKITLAFPSLMEVNVRRCHSLPYLFSSATAKTLDKLATVDVSCCNNLQGIIATEEGKGKTVNKFKFRNLTTLKLGNLENLICFNSESCDGDGLHPLFDEKVQFPAIESIEISQMSNIEKIWIDELPSDAFSKLKMLRVEYCKKLASIFSSDTILTRFRKLEILSVTDCDSLEVIFLVEEKNMSKAPTTSSFLLRQLNLRRLPKLKHVWSGHPGGTLKFECLQCFEAIECEGLQSLFPSSVAKSMTRLEQLWVTSCGMEEIIAEEDGAGTSEGGDLFFPGLTELTLVKLPELRSFYKNTSIWPLLPALFHAEKMPNVEKIWNDELASNAFSKLKMLRVEHCEKLASIFSSDTILARFRKLEILIVTNCSSLEVIFPVEETNMSKAPTTSSFLLRQLNLRRLPKLKHVWSGHPGGTLKFECLQCFEATECEGLQSLFPSLVAKSMTRLERLWVTSCGMEEIIAEEDGAGTSEGGDLFFSGLTVLTLVKLPELRSFYKNTSIWPLLPALFHAEKMPNVEKIRNDELASNAFSKLKTLRVEHCEKLASIFSSDTILARFRKLEILSVTDCGSLEVIYPVEEINMSKAPTTSSFLLRQLNLRRLPKLKHVWSGHPGGTLKFECLQWLLASECESLQSLFPSSVAKSMTRLERLWVTSCGMEEIIAEEDGAGTSEGGDLFFPGLTVLTLVKLPELRSFYKNTLIWPLLPTLFHAEKMPNVEKIWNDELASNAFSKFKTLRVEHCEKLASIFSSDTILARFRKLEILSVTDCGSLEVIFPVEEINMSKAPTTSSFLLRQLNLRRLPKLKHVWSGHPGGTLKFECLQCLVATECENLQSLFPSSVAKSMTRLERLWVTSCGMEEIIAEEDGAGTSEGGDLFFPGLTELTLVKLPELRSFYKNTSIWPLLPTLFHAEKVLFPSMELMKISHMDNMEKIWVDELASNAFSKLKTLIVQYCDKLSFIFSSQSILARFQNLEKLSVIGCGSLEVVFQVQEFRFSKAHSTSTLQLREVILIQLPKIKQVWSGLPQGAFTLGQLRSMKVIGCESLKGLFPSSVAKSMTQLEKLEVWSCGVEEIVADEDGGIGTSVGDLFFPLLTDLRLYDLPQLKGFHRNSHNSTWPLLKNMQVVHCGNMRSFSFASKIESWQGTTINENQPTLFSVEKVFPHLEHLSLAKEDVEMMQHYSFDNLKELDLICYHDENVAFPSDFLLQRFPNLEKLFVHCNSFEDIFPEDAFGHGGETSRGGLSDMQKPLKALENLKHLQLSELCNLRQVWKDGSFMAEIFKQIEMMNINDCPSLSIIFPSPILFQSLTLLQVQNCVGLVHMGTCSAVTSLVQLTQLILKNCGALEDVVIDDGKGVEEISFPKLQWLTLDGLASLESFSFTNSAFMFPSLMGVLVTKCPKMNIFCKGALRTPKLNEVRFSYQDREGHFEGDLNATIQTLSA